MDAIRALHGPSAWVGCSPLAQTGHFIRVIAADSIALRRTVTQIRAILYAALDSPPPAVRRG